MEVYKVIQGMDIFNEGILDFKVVLENAPYQISVERHETTYDFQNDVAIFRVTAYNTRNHKEQKTAFVGITYEAIVDNFQREYDKGTHEIEQLIARRFVYWANANPKIKRPNEPLVITNENLITLSNQRVTHELAEAHLAKYLLDAFRVFSSMVFNMEDLFVATTIERSDLNSAIEYFLPDALGIIEYRNATDSCIFTLTDSCDS